METPTDTDALEPDSVTEEAEPEAQAGYCVKLYVNADGTFSVEGPVPHEPEGIGGDVEGADAGEPLPNIGQALRAVLKIVQDNPIGPTEQEGFEAGYASGPNRA